MPQGLIQADPMTEKNRANYSPSNGAVTGLRVTEEEGRRDLVWVGYLVYLVSIVLGAWAIHIVFEWAASK